MSVQTFIKSQTRPQEGPFPALFSGCHPQPGLSCRVCEAGTPGPDWIAASLHLPPSSVCPAWLCYPAGPHSPRTHGASGPGPGGPVMDQTQELTARGCGWRGGWWRGLVEKQWSLPDTVLVIHFGTCSSTGPLLSLPPASLPLNSGAHMPLRARKDMFLLRFSSPRPCGPCCAMGLLSNRFSLQSYPDFTVGGVEGQHQGKKGLAQDLEGGGTGLSPSSIWGVSAMWDCPHVLNLCPDSAGFLPRPQSQWRGGAAHGRPSIQPDWHPGVHIVADLPTASAPHPAENLAGSQQEIWGRSLGQHG